MIEAAIRPAPRRFLAGVIAGTVALHLLFAGFAAYTLYRSYANLDRRALVATQNLAEVMAQDLAASFGKIDLAVLAVKDEMERQLARGVVDGAAVNAFVTRQAARQADLGGLRVADGEGNVLFGSDVQGRPVNIADWDFFARLRGSRGTDLLVSAPVVGRVSGKWSVALGRRVEGPRGAFGGIAYAAVLLEDFQRRFAKLDLGPHGAVSLRDLDLGTVVRHPEPAALGTAIGDRRHSKEWPEKLKENAFAGSYFAVGLDNRNRALSYRRVGEYPFYIIVGQFPGDYLAEWRQEAAGTALLVLAFVLVTSYFAWMAAQAWRRREAEARTREAERERLMLDLHDGCIQSIYAIGLQLEHARRTVLEDPQRAAKAVAQAEADLNLVIQDLRAFIAGNAPAPYSAEEFMAELERLVPPAGTPGPGFSLDVDRSVAGTLTPDQSVHLLRIAREAVSNAMRHSRATNACLRLQRRGGAIVLEVSDDGAGIPAGAAASAGLGLHHIEARARKLGGRAIVESRPRKGTRVEVQFKAAA